MIGPCNNDLVDKAASPIVVYLTRMAQITLRTGASNAQESGKAGKQLKRKGGEMRMAMYQNLHPATDDPQYVEKMRALYPYLKCPEQMLDLGYQVIYPAVWVRNSDRLTDSGRIAQRGDGGPLSRCAAAPSYHSPSF